MPREQMLEARRAGDGVREPSLPGPGCSAAQSWSGFNLTSWSSYREFADHSQCQADLAPTACLLLAKTTAVGEPALLSNRAAEREAGGWQATGRRRPGAPEVARKNESCS